jgi:hypothetical protein
MSRSVLGSVVACVAIACACLFGTAASADAAEVTVGADVNQTTSESGTCGFATSTERPCTIVTNAINGDPYSLTAPCGGTVTRFRLNGFPRPANHYALRVVHHNGDGTYTGTATSAPVAIATEGVNEYATSLPIALGESIGIDFLESLEEHGLRWVGGIGSSAAVFFDFPADGTAASPTIPSTNFYYLFNADIACGSLAPAPTSPLAPAPVATAPSNSFQVVSLKKTTLTLSLASAGSVTVSEAAPKKKAKAGKKPKALLKLSSGSGGPGPAKLKLALTAAAKARLRATGKVKVKARIAFTPTGGATATQTRALTVKAPRRH